MAIYAHRQPGGFTLGSLLAAAAIVGGLALTLSFGPALPAIAAVVAFMVVVACAWIFRSLTVEVDEHEVRCWFGGGAIRKRIALGEIAAARAVRNRWWHGWGVRRVPRGWMFNVSGLDAVELELRDGRRFRIGTDEPRKLERTIQEALGRR